MERVLQDNHAVHFGLLFEIYAKIPSFNCSLITITDSSFPSQTAGILFSKSAPEWLRNLSLPTIIAFRTMFNTYNNKYRPNLVDLNCNENLNKPLKIQQIASAFYLMIFGIIAAVFVFVVELFFSKMNNMKNIKKDL